MCAQLTRPENEGAPGAEFVIALVCDCRNRDVVDGRVAARRELLV